MLPSDPLRARGPAMPYPAFGLDGLDVRTSPNRGLRGRAEISGAKSTIDCEANGLSGTGS